jgi:hypothetical protein
MRYCNGGRHKAKQFPLMGCTAAHFRALLSPELQGFGNVLRRDRLRSIEIRNGPCDAKEAIVGAGAERQARHRPIDEPTTVAIESGALAQDTTVEPRIQQSISRQLSLASLYHARSNGDRRFSTRLALDIVSRNGTDDDG